MMNAGRILVASWLFSLPSWAADAFHIDARGSTYAQLFQRSLVPGPSGTLVQPETFAALYGYAFLRVTDVDVPWRRDAVSAELSAWGALGTLPQPTAKTADGELVAAWVRHQAGPVFVKIGRQVATPGSARYVRFDGLTVGVNVNTVGVEGYVGFIALPRWNQNRGYFMLGSMSDAIRNTALLEAQSRAGQNVWGARLSWTPMPRWLMGLAFHEQREDGAIAFRNAAFDISTEPADRLRVGGRAVFDLAAFKPSEARIFVDVSKWPRVPASIEYTFQAPALLLPHSSVIAAFGGASWHELGTELGFRPLPAVRLTGRLAGQLYEGDVPGARASLRAHWTPDMNSRWFTLGEYARVVTSNNGYHQLRAAIRHQMNDILSASLDGAVYSYDQPIRTVRISAMGVGSVEYRFTPHARFMISGSIAHSPYAALDAQISGRGIFDLDGSSAGGAW